jgi:aldose sugar dehydrogenase
VGRRGQLQNLEDGPGGPTRADDQFGGPEPDDAHLTGVILRLNDDGSTPTGNPFFAAGAQIGGEVGAKGLTPTAAGGTALASNAR